MKLDAFKALCDREWKREPHGDMQVLHLTGPSLAELAAEALVAAGEESWLVPAELRVAPEQAAAPAVGATLTEIVNPVTRSVVKVRGGSAADMAEVCVALRMAEI